jgi:ubiquinone/menaquinone biosynthesis C-methylase UbiE
MRGRPLPLFALVLVVACSRTGDPHASKAPAPVEAAGDAGPEPPRVYMGRTLAAPMSWQGADWLERTDREKTEQPEHVLDVLAVREGMVVADVGAGSGYFTMRIAKRVGAAGRVIATDLQPEMLAMIKTKLDATKTSNVVTVLATPRDARLPRGEVDLVLMVDVYHELPWPAETMAQVRASLSPRGRLALVEYRAEDPEVAIKPEHKMTLAQIKAELEAARFVFVSSDESLPEQRIVVFTRAP